VRLVRDAAETRTDVRLLCDAAETRLLGDVTETRTAVRCSSDYGAMQQRQGLLCDAAATMAPCSNDKDCCATVARCSRDKTVRRCNYPLSNELDYGRLIRVVKNFQGNLSY
jgi:hypothetical protein